MYEELDISGIYKITNKINGKYYIGKSNNIKRRWKAHRYPSDDMPIHRAIKKYGNQNFEIEVIEQCAQELLEEREIYWIKQFDGYNDKNCYNATAGGDGASHPVKLSQEDVLNIVALLEDGSNTIRDIAKLYNVSSKTISDINCGKSRIVDGKTYPIRENKFDGKHVCVIIADNLEVQDAGDMRTITDCVHCRKRFKCNFRQTQTYNKTVGRQAQSDIIV